MEGRETRRTQIQRRRGRLPVGTRRPCATPIKMPHGGKRGRPRRRTSHHNHRPACITHIHGCIHHHVSTSEPLAAPRAHIVTATTPNAPTRVHHLSLALHNRSRAIAPTPPSRSAVAGSSGVRRSSPHASMGPSPLSGGACLVRMHRTQACVCFGSARALASAFTTGFREGPVQARTAAVVH